MKMERWISVSHKVIFTIIICGCISGIYAQTYTLDDIFSAAVQNNIKLRLAGLEEKNAKATIQEAWSYALPQIDAGLYGQYEANPLNPVSMLGGLQNWVSDVTRALNTEAYASAMSGNPKPYMQVPAPVISNPEKWGYQAIATLTLPLFMWGKIANSITLAKLGFEAKSIQKLIAERELETTITINIAVLFYTKQIIEELQAQEKIVERLYAIANENFKNNLILPLDISYIEVQLIELQTARMRITDMQNQTLAALRELTKLKDITIQNIDFSSMPQEVFSYSRLPVLQSMGEIEKNSAESALLRIQLDAQSAQEKIASSDMFAKPDIALKVEGSFSTSRFFFIDSNWNNEAFSHWNVTVALAINSNIFSGGRNFAALQKAKIEVEKAQLQYASSLDAIEKKLWELDSSLTLKKQLHTLNSAKQKQFTLEAAQKYTEWQTGYSEERAYLEKELAVRSQHIQTLENTLSFISDFCMYQYICGLYPSDYLH